MGFVRIFRRHLHAVHEVRIVLTAATLSPPPCLSLSVKQVKVKLHCSRLEVALALLEKCHSSSCINQLHY